MINKRTVVHGRVKEDTYYSKDIVMFITYDKKYPTIVKGVEIRTVNTEKEPATQVERGSKPFEVSYSVISINDFEKALKEALNFTLFKSSVDYRIKDFSQVPCPDAEEYEYLYL